MWVCYGCLVSRRPSVEVVANREVIDVKGKEWAAAPVAGQA
jgi:hypothetical protein